MIARWLAGAQTWTQTWNLPPDQRVVKVLSPPKSQHKECGVWILYKSVTDAQFEPSKVTFLRLMPSTGSSHNFQSSSSPHKITYKDCYRSSSKEATAAGISQLAAVTWKKRELQRTKAGICLWILQNISNLLLIYAALSHNYSRTNLAGIFDLALSPSANQAPIQALGKHGPFPAHSVWTAVGWQQRHVRKLIIEIARGKFMEAKGVHERPNGIEYLSVHCNILQCTPVPVYHQYRYPSNPNQVLTLC